MREKEREIKRLKEDLATETKRANNTQQKLTTEKQISKGSIERITKLSEQITKLEQQHTEQLRKINYLFDEKAKDYERIDFEGLYELLETKAKEND